MIKSLFCANNHCFAPILKLGKWCRKIFLAVLLIGLPATGFSDSGRTWQPWIELAGGMVYQTLNDVQIPADQGTRFSLSEKKQGPWPAYRIYAGLHFLTKHEIVGLYAPLQIQEKGSWDKDIVFREQTYSANKPIDFTYKFNSYRFTYRYDLWSTKKWLFKIGFTGKIRDARIALKQDGVASPNDQELDNIGFVPLVHFFLSYHFTPGWSLQFYGDALASPYGRAEDVALKLNYQVTDHIQISGGYRTVEGGSDGSGGVYTFAWLHYGEFSMRYDF